MEHLGVERLRRQTSDCVARAEAGESFMVLRHSRPLAVLRAARFGDWGEDIPVSRFRGDLRRLLGSGPRRPIRLTYRGRRIAVVAPVPPRVRRLYRTEPVIVPPVRAGEAGEVAG